MLELSATNLLPSYDYDKNSGMDMTNRIQIRQGHYIDGWKVFFCTLKEFLIAGKAASI